jgi:hypothetical protein
MKYSITITKDIDDTHRLTIRKGRKLLVAIPGFATKKQALKHLNELEEAIAYSTAVYED